MPSTFRSDAGAGEGGVATSRMGDGPGRPPSRGDTPQAQAGKHVLNKTHAAP